MSKSNEYFEEMQRNLSVLAKDAVFLGPQKKKPFLVSDHGQKRTPEQIKEDEKYFKLHNTPF